MHTLTNYSKIETKTSYGPVEYSSSCFLSDDFSGNSRFIEYTRTQIHTHTHTLTLIYTHIYISYGYTKAPAC